MEISHHLPTKVIGSFEFINNEYIPIEFMSGDYFYILSNSAIDQLLMIKIDMSGVVVSRTTFNVDSAIYIAALDNYIIEDEKMYGIYNVINGMYLCCVDLEKEEGYVLSFIANIRLYECSIVVCQNYVLVFGGTEYFREMEECFGRILIYDFVEKTSRMKYIDLHFRRNALAYQDGDDIIVRYGYDNDNYLVESIEIFHIKDLEDLDIISPEIHYPSKLKDALLSYHFGEISNISYLGDANEMYILLQKGGTYFLFVNIDEEFFSVGISHRNIILLQKTSNYLSVMIDQNVIFLQKRKSTLKNFMIKYIRKNNLYSANDPCPKVRNLIEKAKQKCATNFF